MSVASTLFGGLLLVGGCLYYGLREIADALRNRRVEVNVPPVIVTLSKSE